MKRYASPGGGAIIKAHDTTYWVKRPAKGALKGLLLAKNDGYGRIPSRPSSWMTVGTCSLIEGLWFQGIHLYLGLERTGPLEGYLTPTGQWKYWVPNLVQSAYIEGGRESCRPPFQSWGRKGYERTMPYTRFSSHISSFDVCTYATILRLPKISSLETAAK